MSLLSLRLSLPNHSGEALSSSADSFLTRRRAADPVSAVLRVILPLIIGLLFITPAAHAQMQFLLKFGDQGRTSGTFLNPRGVATDNSGNLYVVDSSNYRVQKFDNNGTYLGQFGTGGTGNGQFYNPAGIAVDSAGNIYVSDLNPARIQKFDSSFTYVTQFGFAGSNDGGFTYIAGMAVDSVGNVYTTDLENPRVQKFSSTGAFLGKFGSLGSGDGQFSSPAGIAIDRNGNIYVADSGNNRIQKFDSNGNFLRKFGSYGTGNGQFNYPRGIGVDVAGYIYVLDANNYRVQKFDSNGNYLEQVGSYGGGDGQLRGTWGIGLDTTNHFFVSESANRIQKFATGETTLVPVLGSIDPTQIPIRSSDTTITVTGSNFTYDAVVRYSSTSLTTNYVSGTQLTATIPASKLKQAGILPINVYRTLTGQSNRINLTVANPVPVLNELYDTSALIGSGDLYIFPVGADFTSTSRVYMGTRALQTTFYSPNVIMAMVPSSLLQKVGTMPVTVYNPTPGGGTSEPITFSVISPTPYIGIVTPNSATELTPSVTIQLSGNNFVPASKIVFGSRTLSTTFVSSAILKATIPAASLVALGTTQIKVVNPSPADPGNTMPFTVTMGQAELALADAPTVTRSSSKLTVTVTLKNTSSYSARDITVTGAQLGSTASTGISTTTLFKLGQGATRVITLTFPPSAAAPGTTPTVSLTYSSTNAGSSTLSTTTATVP